MTDEYSKQHAKLSRTLFRRARFRIIESGNIKRHDKKKFYPNYYANQILRRNNPKIKKIRNGKIISVSGIN